MQFVSERNIAKVSFLYALIVVSILIFSTGALFITNKYTTLNDDLAALENTFIEEEKVNLKNDVRGLIARINSSRSNAHDLLKEQLKRRTEEAIAIADNLYDTYDQELSRSELVDLIGEAIRPIRFNEDQSYFFILTGDGDSILHPINTRVEGSNLLEAADHHLRSVGRKIITAAANRQGYISYKWPMPGKPSDELYEKISYVDYYKPLDLVFGTGEYLDNLDALAKSTITNELAKSLQFYKEDYYFIYDLHNIEGGKNFATMLINSNREDLVGRKISDDYLDANGKHFRREFLKDIRETGESFIVYWYQKPEDSGVGRKLAYFKLFPEWNWIVARGIYFDRLDRVIAEQKKSLAARVKKDILMLCAFFVAAVTIALLVAYHFSSQLQKIFDSYRRSQEESYAQLESLHKELKEKSRKDPLTGLFNRGHFNRQLAIETSRSTRYGTPLGLLLIDIDKFKNINDTYGHLTGDSVLQAFARLIGGNIRRTDVLARWGGEEFAILAPGLDLHHTGLFAEKLRDLIEKHDFPVERTVTCSFGVVSFNAGEDISVLLQRADNALYSAKEKGRNCCVAG